MTRTWADRRETIGKLDADAWDEATQRYDDDWHKAYVAAFVAFAVSRSWKRADAEVWAEEIWYDAGLNSDKHGYDPDVTARHDVIECEIEAANA